MSTSISYPHPVLGNGDDVTVGLVDPDVSYEISDEVVRLDITKLVTGNEAIESLIADDKAGWQVRVQCPRTYVRENLSAEPHEHSVRLLGPDYEGEVNLEIVVAAKDGIDSYLPTGAHADYGDEPFSISCGEVLAISPAFTFFVEKKFDPLKAPVASIVRVDPGEHEQGPFRLVLDDDFIVIQLSKTDWREYAGIKDRVPTVIHSALVLPALAEAIRKLEDHRLTLWGGRLKHVLEENGIDCSRPLEAAQEILASPVARTFVEVNAILDRGDH